MTQNFGRKFRVITASHFIFQMVSGSQAARKNRQWQMRINSFFVDSERKKHRLINQRQDKSTNQGRPTGKKRTPAAE